MKTWTWICILGLLVISMIGSTSYYSSNSNYDYYEESQSEQIIEDALISAQLEELEDDYYEVYEGEEERCDYGYSDEYKCDRDKIKREWVSSDCSSRWFYFDWCDYGCYDGECLKPESEPIDDVETIVPEEKVEDKSNLPICSYNTYNCDYFKNQNEAQSVMEYCEAITGEIDIHWLDGDDDGVACELNSGWDSGKSNLNFGLLGN